MEPINFEQFVQCVQEKRATCWNVVAFHLNNLNGTKKGMHGRQELAIDKTTSDVDRIFSSESIPMARQNIKTRLKKMFKMYENQSRNFHKQKAAVYLATFRQKMQEPFHNPRARTEELIEGELEALVDDVGTVEQENEEDMEMQVEYLDEEQRNEEDMEIQEIEIVEESGMDVFEEDELEEEQLNDSQGDSSDTEWLPDDPVEEEETELASKFVVNAIKSPELTKACFATQTSPNDLMLITAAMNDANKVPSKGNAESTIYNQQRKHQAAIAAQKRVETSNFLRDQSVFLHYDEKCLKNTTQDQDEANHIERCAIVASCSNGSRLLAIKKLLHGTGDGIAQALHVTATEYEILQFLVGIVIDTTLSNTGLFNGSAAILERMINRFLLYLGCRHHIYEVYLKTCFEIIFGASDAPTLSKLKIVQDMWSTIDKSQFKILRRLPSIPESKRQALVAFYRNIGPQVRGDYEEAAHLALMLLGSGDSFSFRKPAGDSNARWLSKVLYIAKSYMFGTQLSFTKEDLKHMHDFLHFCVYVYLPAWYRAPFITEAAITDIQFANDLHWFRKFSVAAADSILRKMNNHSWYLGQELSWTCLFSKSLPEGTRVEMINKLKSCAPEWNQRGIKLHGDQSLVTKKSPIIDIRQLDLVDLVDGRSVAVMQRLGLTYEWSTEAEFDRQANIVAKIPCTNDICERAIHLASTVQKSGPHTEDARQDYYLVVDEAQKIPRRSLTALNNYYATKY